MQYKFRGKRVDNGEWVYGDFCNGFSTDMPDFIRAIEYGMSVFHQVHPDSVGMWTGLVDKTGAEIYEGDVLVYEVNCIRVVEWEPTFAKWQVRSLTGIAETLVLSGNTPVIIGNVTDNPELLETK